MARTDMYRKLPWTGGDPRSVAEIVNNLVEGKSNNTGDNYFSYRKCYNYYDI
jgi:hypothetical protein